MKQDLMDMLKKMTKADMEKSAPQLMAELGKVDSFMQGRVIGKESPAMWVAALSGLNSVQDDVKRTALTFILFRMLQASVGSKLDTLENLKEAHESGHVCEQKNRAVDFAMLSPNKKIPEC